MREKKTEVMTIRVTPATKQAIVREAERREWTPSKMAEKILTAWAEREAETGSHTGTEPGTAHGTDGD